MLNTVYRLYAPRSFQPIVLDAPIVDKVIVRPTYLSICNADQRYYQGTRSKEVLRRKLPMALIHEGVGEVVSDQTGVFSRGAKVVLLPNDPTETDPVIAENYLTSSHFCGSGYDGFLQEAMILSPERLVELPRDINLEVAAFTELVSVAVHAVSRFEGIAHNRKQSIGVWGDGNLGFIVSLVLRRVFPNAEVVVYGRNREKLNDFTFVSRICLVDEENLPTVDHAFECCGGDGSIAAIDQIIDRIRPEGTISLLGVSENPVPINTRMVLEKGLRLFGSSRSGRKDFERTVALYESNPEMLEYLQSLVNEVRVIRSVSDISAAFEADIRKPMGKTIMKWEM
ncbi:alcohol dehydrogenase catalytic domain-containing protein [Parvibacter caecicola]|uniref:Ribulose-5-phosphate reductase n=1 Tax=Parvibacter caecicola TaxID=747645 RepID=A0A4T9T8G1_9ACTN|nr:alcohol dehydrogenase catalytic domain-containing protein [Parvibacter caecicola]TJW11338.1 ribitol-5-phosphate dehydrogenase [Parvibacter caecicola]